jgi:flagellar motor protein MotB
MCTSLLRLFVLVCCSIAFLLASCVREPLAAPYASILLPPYVNPHDRISLIEYLDRHGVQVIPRGGSLRVLLPTDHFFVGQTNEVNLDCLPLLAAVASLAQTYTGPTGLYVWVTAYTDEVGTPKAKKERSEQQAEVIAAFLWARGVPARIMQIKGFGDKERISSNRIVGGSADNRRIEIGIPRPFTIQGW